MERGLTVPRGYHRRPGAGDPRLRYQGDGLLRRVQGITRRVNWLKKKLIWHHIKKELHMEAPIDAAVYLLKLHFVAGHRRVIGGTLILVSALLFGATHLGAADPRLTEVSTYLASFGAYALTVGI